MKGKPKLEAEDLENISMSLMLVTQQSQITTNVERVLSMASTLQKIENLKGASNAEKESTS